MIIPNSMTAQKFIIAIRVFNTQCRWRAEENLMYMVRSILKIAMETGEK